MKIVLPKTAERETTYAGLKWITHAWSEELTGPLIVVGPPGLGKSTTVARAAGPGACLVEGMTSAASLYQRLYGLAVPPDAEGEEGGAQGEPFVPGRPLILDDVDSLFRDPAGASLFKQLAIDKPEKLVSWGTLNLQVRAKGIPHFFPDRPEGWGGVSFSTSVQEPRGCEGPSITLLFIRMLRR
jgi:hypothetical protein